MEETLVCASCQQEKAIEQFKTVFTYTQDSRGIWRKTKLSKPQCIDCKRLFARQHARKHKYGLSPAAFEALRKKAKNQCMICHVSFDELSTKTIHVDHCHRTNKVRGLLCQGCNLGLGGFRDDPKSLASAIEYLAI